MVVKRMVVKRPLPQIASGILIGKPFQYRNYAWHQFRDDLGAPSSRKTEINI